MGISGVDGNINETVTDMLLQFSASKQNEIFQLIQSSNSLFFYLALSFAIIGGVILLIKPSLWNIRVISGYFFILLILITISIQNNDLFFNNVAINNQNEKIFSPQAVVLNIANKINSKLANTLPVERKIDKLLKIKDLTSSNPKMPIEMSYYKEICTPIAGAKDEKYIGRSVNNLAKIQEGRAFINKLAHSYFNLKHVYWLNSYYYSQVNINPVVGSILNPVYAAKLSDGQTYSDITAGIKKRLSAYTSKDNMKILGWDKDDTWLNESNGIIENIKQVKAVTARKKALKIPEFLIQNTQGLANNEIVFRTNMKPYITSYGFKKQMDYPVVIFLAEDDNIFNCLDFHERVTQNIKQNFQASEFFKSDNYLNLVDEFSNILPQQKIADAESILLDDLITPLLAKKLYKTDVSNNKSMYKIKNLFAQILSLLLAIFLLITPLLLLVGLLLPMWSYGIIFMLVLVVGWFAIWQIFLTIGNGIYNYIAPSLLSDISIKSFEYIYIYGAVVVQGVVSIFAVLLLPIIIKSLPFDVKRKTSIFSKEKPLVAVKQLDNVLQKLKNNIPEKIMQKVLPENTKQQQQTTIKPVSVVNEKLTEKATNNIRETSAVAKNHVSAMGENNHISKENINNTTVPEPKSATVTGTTSGGNAYGMFQKVVQENYMTLGHDAVNALQLTEKHMKNMTSDDMRSGEDGETSYVEVKQTALKEKISGGKNTKDGYVRFYSK